LKPAPTSVPVSLTTSVPIPDALPESPPSPPSLITDENRETLYGIFDDIQNENYQAALVLFDNLDVSDLKKSEIRNLKANVLSILGSQSYKNRKKDKNALKDAVYYYDMALDINPDDTMALQGRGNILRKEKKYEAAFRDLDRAASLEPKDYWIACDKGNVLIDLGRKKEALEVFEQAINLSEDNFVALVFAAGLNEELKHNGRAKELYRAVIDIKPEYYFAYERLGVLYMNDGNWNDAKNAFGLAYSRSPTQSAQLSSAEADYALLAIVNWLKIDTKEKVQPFIDTVMRRIPQNSDNWYLLRTFMLGAGEKEITRMIQKTAEPLEKGRLLFYLGQYYDIQNKPAAANRMYAEMSRSGRPGGIEWQILQNMEKRWKESA
jgi:tetratricopeptide (TPR) repeat protein